MRVEVKSACAARETGNGYTVSTYYQPLKRGYSLAEADFLAIHVPPVDAWYIIPVERLHNVKSMRVYPHRATTRSRWEAFREAWELMEGEKTGRCQWSGHRLFQRPDTANCKSCLDARRIGRLAEYKGVAGDGLKRNLKRNLAFLETIE